MIPDSPKVDIHIRALARLIRSVGDSQIDEIYFLIGGELRRRQDEAGKREAAKHAPP